MKRIVLLLGCLAWMPAQAGDLYRWVDAQGKVHYGDVPPAEAAQIEEKKFAPAETPGADLPYATRRAQQDFPVTLYVSDNCAEYCDQARRLLNQRGIPYTEKKLATQEDIDAFKALSGSDSAPTLAVGRTFLKGFLATQWHGELDVAGYPKIAPYRSTAPPATAIPAAPPAAAGETIPDSPAAQ